MILSKLRTLAIVIAVLLITPAAWAAPKKVTAGGGSSNKSSGEDSSQNAGKGSNQSSEGKGSNHSSDQNSGGSSTSGSGGSGGDSRLTAGGDSRSGGGGSTLHIGFGAGTPCAVGCGGHPNVSGASTPSASFDISQTSGGAPTLNPVLLIVGVPDQTNPAFFSQSSVSALTSINPYPDGAHAGSLPAAWTYGTTAFGLGSDIGFGVASGYRGEFTASTGGDVYSFLGLTGGNNSNNWTNWHGGELANAGVDAGGFGIYVFALNAELASKGLLYIEFQNVRTVPTGSYLIAYGSSAPFDSGANRITTSSTPFTEAGLYNASIFYDAPPLHNALPPQAEFVSEIPEPGTLLLLGSGLAGLTGLAWRRQRQKATCRTTPES